MIRPVAKYAFWTAVAVSAASIFYALASTPPAEIAAAWHRWSFNIAFAYALPLGLYIDAAVRARKGSKWYPVLVGFICLGAGAGAWIDLWTEALDPLTRAIAAQQQINGHHLGSAIGTMLSAQPVMTRWGVGVDMFVALADIAIGLFALLIDLPDAIKTSVADRRDKGVKR